MFEDTGEITDNLRIKFKMVFPIFCRIGGYLLKKKKKKKKKRRLLVPTPPLLLR